MRAIEFCAVITSVLLFVLIACQQVSDEEIVRQVQAQVERHRGILIGVLTDLGDAQDQLDELRDDVDDVQGQFDKLRGAVNDARNGLDGLGNDVDALQDDMEFVLDGLG